MGKMITASELITEPFSLPAAGGGTMRGEIDRAAGGAVARCILLPAFGLTSLDLLALAYYLLCNGFEVVRFDPTCHVGTSDGEVIDFRLGQLAADIDRVVEVHADRDTSVIGISLSSRAAFRALARHMLRGVFFLSPVVNTRQTLFEVCSEDLVGKYLDRSLPELYSILGLTVNREFCGDCLDQNLASLNGTLTDAASIAVPTCLIVGSEDRWVATDEVERVAAVMPTARMVTISGANHQMFKSPVIFQSYIATLLREMFSLYDLVGEPIVPRFADVVRYINGVKRESKASAVRRVGQPLHCQESL